MFINSRTQDKDLATLQTQSIKETLQLLLQRNITYNVVSVMRSHNQHCYIEELIRHTTQGTLVVNLKYVLVTVLIHMLWE